MSTPDPKKPPLPESIKAYALFASPAGQQILEDIRARFGADAPVFIETPGQPFDPIRAAIRDGQRQVILHIQRATNLATHEQTPKASHARIA